MRRISDQERRHRLAVRHALAPVPRVATPEQATEAVTVLHSTEPATVYLSLWARVDGLQRPPTSTARSTTTARWSSSWPCGAPCSSSRATWCPPPGAARRPGRPVPRDAGWPRTSSAPASPPTAPPGWTEACEAVLERLRAEPAGLHRRRGPRGRAGPRRAGGAPAGGAWGSARVLTYLGAAAEVVRGVNTGHWRTSRPRWTTRRGLAGGDAPPARRGRGLCRPGGRGGCTASVPAPRPTSCGGWAAPRPSSAGRSATSAPSGSSSTPARPAGCCPTTWSPSPTRARGWRCCPCSTPR